MVNFEDVALFFLFLDRFIQDLALFFFSSSPSLLSIFFLKAGRVHYLSQEMIPAHKSVGQGFSTPFRTASAQHPATRYATGCVSIWVSSTSFYDLLATRSGRAS